MIRWLTVAVLFTSSAQAVSEKIVPCTDKTAQIVRVARSKITTLNFPTTPKEAIPGEKGFDLKRVQDDLVIKPLLTNASTNLIVYLEGRRCFFHLVTGPFGDESVFVRDERANTVEVKFAN